MAFAAPRVAAGVVFTDTQAQVLMLRTTYKEIWDIPGGYVEPGEANYIETVLYGQDGVVRYREKDKLAGEVRNKSIRDVPLDINWERVPEFGNWDSVPRYDREPPATEPERRET